MKPSDINKKKPEMKKWHTQQEIILKSWGEASACLRVMHFKSYLKFKSQNFNFTLPIIVISTVTGTANFAQETFPESIRQFVPIGIGGLNLVGAIMTTITTFLKVTELMEAHRVASISYGKLARDITLELLLPISERHHHGGSMIDRCSAEYDRLIEQSPPVPKGILHRFENTYKNHDEFEKPGINTITPITIYDSLKEVAQTANVANLFKKGLGGIFPKKPLGVQEPIINELKDIIVAPPTTRTPMSNVMEELQQLKNKNLVSVGIGDEFFESEQGDDDEAEEVPESPDDDEN